MGNKSSKNLDSPLPNFEILVLHTVEKHEKVLIAGDERVKLRIQMLQHSDSDPVLVISGRSDEEPVQELVDDALDVVTNLHLIRAR